MSDSSHYRFIAIAPHVANPGPIEMHVNATLFVRDGEALGDRATAGQFFLFVHGIELALKSFLHEKGVGLSELRHVGHRLSALLNECNMKGMVPSVADTSSILRRLDSALERAKLRYEFSFDLPSLDDVRRVATGVLRDTKPALPPLR
jgi:hypothetical protein